MKDEAIIKATVWVEVPAEYIEDIKWFKQGEELAAKTDTLTINDSNIAKDSHSGYSCEIEADGLPENFSGNMMVKLGFYNLDGSPRKPVFREPKSKDHGINGVARQKDVQKLKEQLETSNVNTCSAMARLEKQIDWIDNNYLSELDLKGGVGPIAALQNRIEELEEKMKYVLHSWKQE